MQINSINKKTVFKILFFVFLFFILNLVEVEAVTLENPLRTSNIVELLNEIIKEITFKLAPILVTLFVLIGAFQILFASGDPKKFEVGQRTIKYAVVGYLILLLSSGIVFIIKEILTKGKNS